MKILFLMSSLRSGSHMVRSMLANDPLIQNRRGEHSPLADVEQRDVYGSPGTTMVPLKYGYAAATSDCLNAAAYPSACALILHRRDSSAQALSLAHARRNGSWFGPTDRDEAVTVTAAEVEKLAARNARDLVRLRALQMPHVVLAYEDITIGSLKASLDQLLGREVVVVEPSTVKIAAA